MRPESGSVRVPNGLISNLGHEGGLTLALPDFPIARNEKTGQRRIRMRWEAPSSTQARRS